MTFRGNIAISAATAFAVAGIALTGAAIIAARDRDRTHQGVKAGEAWVAHERPLNEVPLAIHDYDGTSPVWRVREDGPLWVIGGTSAMSIVIDMVSPHLQSAAADRGMELTTSIIETPEELESALNEMLETRGTSAFKLLAINQTQEILESKYLKQVLSEEVNACTYVIFFTLSPRVTKAKSVRPYFRSVLILGKPSKESRELLFKGTASERFIDGVQDGFYCIEK